METHKTCSFFGHREIEETQDLKQRLYECIEDLILNNHVGTFLFGSKSDFNSLCLKTVSLLKEKYPEIKRVFYTCKSETCFLEKDREKWEKLLSRFGKQILTVDEEFEHKTKYTAGKATYVERNKAMIDDSDFCVFYYDENYLPKMRKFSKSALSLYQPKSGTQIAYEYAKQKNKIIKNLLE